ncbi:hypothetical protein QI155_10790 [Thermodesulfovibrio sp. 1176]|uniref:hypothetical protein n=1 Tax=Thermodesulfovibrio sp. 1176 TaxID=3043424 RepID=UPI002482BAEA|nr:hypothetical protein [Thermodesulfovibrio sp. 1176]MDI1473018.1 hypothetical protein [Thermodesulfovibrio sp. 1176]
MTESVAQEAKSKGQIILERKMKQIQDTRSIVVLISESALPRELVFSIFELDKKINSIMRNVGFSISLTEAKKKIEEVRKKISSLWDKLKEVIPGFFTFNYEQWNEVNDTYEQKQLLIRRRNSIVFIPRSNEGAQIMMAFKILSKKRIDFSAEGNFEGIEKIARIYLDFGSQIKTLNESLSIKQNNDGSDK